MWGVFGFLIILILRSQFFIFEFIIAAKWKTTPWIEINPLHNCDELKVVYVRSFNK